jgi:hypothetical protein
MRLSPLLAPATATAVALCLSAAMFRVSGASVDLFVTVTLLVAMTTPLVVAWNRSVFLAGFTSGAFAFAMVAGWFWIAHLGNITWPAACRASAVGFLLGMALSGTARLLSGGAGGRFWPGFIGLLGLAWVSWPVWLSDPLSGKTLVWSVALQPLFAVNSAVPDLGNWVDQPMAYQLTSFGQDVLYQMPKSVWPAVLFHGMIGLVTWTVAVWRERPRNAPPPA